MSASDVLKTIQENDVKFIDFRFTDTRGKEQHVSVPAHTLEEETFEEGKMFDGSSIAGWKGINASDMILMPEADTAVIDPFTDEVTMIIRCDVIEPDTMQRYERDPRSIAKPAETYLKSTGIADTAYFGPEPEFFVFDDVRFQNEMGSVGYSIDSSEAAWNGTLDDIRIDPFSGFATGGRSFQIDYVRVGLVPEPGSLGLLALATGLLLARRRAPGPSRGASPAHRARDG